MYNIDRVRKSLFQMLDKLSDEGCDVKKETERALSMIEVAKAILETGKMEIEFAKAVKREEIPMFFTVTQTADPVQVKKEEVKRIVDNKSSEPIVVDSKVDIDEDEEEEVFAPKKSVAVIEPLNSRKVAVSNAVTMALEDANRPMLGIELRAAAQKKKGGAIMEFSQFNKMLTDAISKRAVIKKHINEFDWYVLSVWLDEDEEEFLNEEHQEYIDNKQTEEA